MGNILECTSGDKEAVRLNKEIGKKLLARDRMRRMCEEKWLLLGAGGSGKRTFAKQMSIIHLVAGFSVAERGAFRVSVFYNVIKTIQTLIIEMEKRDIALEDGAARDLLMCVALNNESPLDYTPAVAEAVGSLWRESAVQTTFARSRELQLDDSAKYFLDNCTKFAAPDYTPDKLDILRTRLEIKKTSFVVRNMNLLIVDISIQRNAWIHCFRDVPFLIFCVAMNEYDMLLEDNTTNRLQESLRLFEEVINLINLNFTDTPVFLFFNKKDLFEQKIMAVDMSCCFPEYDGGLNYEKASEYLSEKFKGKNTNRRRDVISHFLTTTDTKNVWKVFDAVESSFRMIYPCGLDFFLE
jgi:guanine nucleotide-binding protein G(o) subunit alpha